jgi:hypothetical protein
MGNLSRQDSPDPEERALAPHSRKSSNPYNPPQNSRTQQKLWLQRASSNIEPQQMGPGTGLNGIPGPSLVNAGYDGRDPRVRLQLERTGLEYLVVRRYQDPIGTSIKRLAHLPGVDKSRLIPAHQNGNLKRAQDGGANKYGLSQSLGARTKSSAASVKTSGARSSYDAGESDGEREDDGVGDILRGLWDKSLLDLGSSQ